MSVIVIDPSSGGVAEECEDAFADEPAYFLMPADYGPHLHEIGLCCCGRPLLTLIEEMAGWCRQCGRQEED